MKAFKFRLETLLKVRKIETEQQAKALGLAQQKLFLTEQELVGLEDAVVQEVQRLKDLSGSGEFSKQMAELSENFREGLKRQMQTKRREIEQCKLAVEQEQRKLIEREKKKKVLDKLKEKEFEKYEDENRKMETKLMDEIASIFFQRDSHNR